VKIKHDVYIEDDDGNKLPPSEQELFDDCVQLVREGWKKVNPNTPISKPTLYSIVSPLWERGLIIMEYTDEEVK
jgi:hypothetical protein